MVSNTTAAISESLQAEKWGHDSRNVFLEHSRTERKQDIFFAAQEELCEFGKSGYRKAK